MRALKSQDIQVRTVHFTVAANSKESKCVKMVQKSKFITSGDNSKKMW